MRYTLKNIIILIIWIPLALLGNLFVIIQTICESVHTVFEAIQSKFDDMSDK